MSEGETDVSQDTGPLTRSRSALTLTCFDELVFAAPRQTPSRATRSAKRRKQRLRAKERHSSSETSSQAQTADEGPSTATEEIMVGTYGDTWGPLMGPAEYSQWAKAPEVVALLRQLRATRFAIAEKRDQALGLLDALQMQTVVAQTTRFPETGQWINTDEISFAMMVNKIRSCLGFKDPVVDRGGRGAEANAQVLDRAYNDSARGYNAALNEMQTYLMSSMHVWTRAKFEAYHGLRWQE